MQIKNEQVKVIYDGETIKGFFHNNGTLKLFKAEPATYTDIEDLLDQKPEEV